MRAIITYEYKPGIKLSGKRVIALGFFDGVHLGHREILRKTAEEAHRLSLPAAVFTFTSDSVGIKDEKRIYSTEKKLEIFEECGIDEVVLAEFESIRLLSAPDFIKGTLTDDLGCKLALCGNDFKFGHKATGNTELLEKELKKYGARLICQGDVLADGEKISSSRIKALIEKGSVKEAAKLLGAPYSVKSKVRHGLGLGKTFGFPTVNTEIEAGFAALAAGVYKAEAEIGGKRYNALSNVGVCPTVGKRKKHIETYLIDCEGDLYGESIVINFLDFIRPEKKFDSTEELIMQIKLDIYKTFGQKEQ